MNNFWKYSNQFFDALEVFEDVERGHSYKVYMRQSVIEFLENENKETAFAVYRSFFDSYRITMQKDGNSFIDLLDVLRSYEENASTLIDKQRDHYVHSVNVFLLGLCIYIQNENYRAAFDQVNLDKAEYPYSYGTKHEEFFYRWGLASLFHDVGYPVEIIGKQINKFMAFATEVDDEAKVRSHLEFDNFEELNSIVEVLPKREFIKSYYEKYDSCVYVDLLKPIDLLAHKLHISLDVDLKGVKSALDGFVTQMAKSGFVDHGFYSAIIVLKWYGFLIQCCRYKPEYFYFPVLDSASAILLHNYYKNAIMKPPFSKGSLSPFEHPIAFLLILCDELQEWNREAYGILDRKRTHASKVSLMVTNQRLNITYITRQSALPESFSSEKENLLRMLLEMDAIFKDGFSVTCEVMEGEKRMASVASQEQVVEPRPLMDNLEKLAISIHKMYNQKQQERNPDQPLAYPSFSDLPDTMKYSNLRQARSIADKLKWMGWEMRPQDNPGKRVTTFPDDVVEALARIEHEDWARERQRSGWVYGEDKDVDNKVSPYLIPYQELPDEIKEYDRDAVRNIPELLAMIGMAIYEKER